MAVYCIGPYLQLGYVINPCYINIPVFVGGYGTVIISAAE